LLLFTCTAEFLPGNTPTSNKPEFVGRGICLTQVIISLSPFRIWFSLFLVLFSSFDSIRPAHRATFHFARSRFVIVCSPAPSFQCTLFICICMYVYFIGVVCSFLFFLFPATPNCGRLQFPVTGASRPIKKRLAQATRSSHLDKQKYLHKINILVFISSWFRPGPWLQNSSSTRIPYYFLQLPEFNGKGFYLLNECRRLSLSILGIRAGHSNKSARVHVRIQQCRRFYTSMYGT